MLKIATLTSSVNRNEESQNSSTVRILPHSDLSLSSHLLLISSYFFFVSFRTLFCIKLRGRDGSRVQILPRNHRHHCLSLLSNILTLNIRFVARLSSAMDLRFGIFVILLIVTFIWQPTDSKDSGNRGSSKKNNSTKIQLSKDIATNPFLQQSINLSIIEDNPFLSGNRSEKPFDVVPNIFLPQETNVSSIAIFTNNPFLNFGTDTRVDMESSDALVTQAPYRPLPLAPTINTPPTSYAPAPVHNSFTTSLLQHPFIKVEPPSSGTPSLPDIESIRIGSTKTKSELKCDEYVREFAGTTEITSLVGTSSNVIKLDNVCRDANRLVVGGTETRIGEFPHMVALGKRDSDETFNLMCGGTLISHIWVLSAAHCTYGPNGGPSDARLGSHRLTDQQGVTVAIKTMIRHPDFNPPAMYADIALVELTNTVTFSTLIRPACLYQQYDTVPRSAWVSGWGVTEFGGDQTDQLHKAQLDLVDNLACTIRYNSSIDIPYGVTPSMVCAGDRSGWSKDSCQGDSGGPLQVIHPKNLCVFQVIGITSFGQGCALIDTPGVYTRVSHYISWIENIVWPQ